MVIMMIFPNKDEILEAVKKANADAYYAGLQFEYPLEYFISRLKKIKMSGSKVLDAGCGFGNWSIALSELFEQVHACDYSENMLEVLNFLQEKMNVTNISKKTVNLSKKLPYESNTFDAVICYGVLMFVDVKKALKEFYRVLKPGGQVYLCLSGDGFYLHRLFEGRDADRAESTKNILYNTYWKRFINKHMTKSEIHTKIEEYLGDDWVKRLNSDRKYFSWNFLSKLAPFWGSHALLDWEIKQISASLGFTDFMSDYEGCLELDSTIEKLEPVYEYIQEYKGHLGVWECLFTKP